MIAAEKETEQIAIEIKHWANRSIVYAWHNAVGQYRNYRRGLEQSELHQDRFLFLAVSANVYHNYLSKEPLFKMQ